MCDSNGQQSDQSLCLALEFSMTVKLLTEHHLEFLSLKGGYTGSSESTLVKIQNCWKTHAAAHIIHFVLTIKFFLVIFFSFILLFRAPTFHTTCRTHVSLETLIIRGLICTRIQKCLKIQDPNSENLCMFIKHLIQQVPQ